MALWRWPTLEINALERIAPGSRRHGHATWFLLGQFPEVNHKRGVRFGPSRTGGTNGLEIFPWLAVFDRVSSRRTCRERRT
jgi:hypothetical protein